MASRIFKNIDIKTSSKDDNPFMLPCIKHMVCNDSVTNDAIVNYVYDILPLFYKIGINSTSLKTRFDYLQNYVNRNHIRENFTLSVSVDTKEAFEDKKCMLSYSSICGGSLACEGCPRNKKYLQSSFIKDEELLMKFLLEKESKFQKYFPTVKEHLSDIFLCPIDLNANLKNLYYVPVYKTLFADVLLWISENTDTYYSSVNGSSRDSVLESCYYFIYNRYGNPPELMLDNVKTLLSDIMYGYVENKTGLSEKDFEKIVNSRINKEYLPKKVEPVDDFVIGEQQSLFDDIDFASLSKKDDEVANDKATPEISQNDNANESKAIDDNTTEIKSGEDSADITDNIPVLEDVVEQQTDEIPKDATSTDEQISDTESVVQLPPTTSHSEDTEQSDKGSLSVLDMLDMISGTVSKEETPKEENPTTMDIDSSANTPLEEVSDIESSTSERNDEDVSNGENSDEDSNEALEENDSVLNNISDEELPMDVPFVGEDNYILDNRQDICLKYSMDLAEPGAIMDFENAVLKDRFMSIEAIRDSKNKEILIFRSRRGSVPFFHVYMDNKECMDYIAPYLSRRSFTKICYQPYYLYSYCRKYNAPLKRVYSICTCHSLLVSEYSPENTSNLKVLSYRDTLESYMSEDWKENIPALLAGMSVYAYVLKQQERGLRVVEDEGFSSQSMLNEMDELVYYDEALGLSYCLDKLFSPDTHIDTLFKLSGHNEFEYAQVDTIKTIPAGKFVEFQIDTELTKLEYAHQIIRGVIIDLVENGRFRKINMYIISAQNNRLRLFIPEYYFHHLMTILSSTFTSVARKIGVDKLNYKTIIKKAESSEQVEKVPVIDL